MLSEQMKTEYMNSEENYKENFVLFNTFRNLGNQNVLMIYQKAGHLSISARR